MGVLSLTLTLRDCVLGDFVLEQSGSAMRLLIIGVMGWLCFSTYGQIRYSHQGNMVLDDEGTRYYYNVLDQLIAVAKQGGKQVDEAYYANGLLAQEKKRYSRQKPVWLYHYYCAQEQVLNSLLQNNFSGYLFTKDSVLRTYITFGVRHAQVYITNRHRTIIMTATHGAVMMQQYGEYGKPIFRDNSVNLNANPLRYAGYFWDVATSLYYLRARFYLPWDRIFLSRDQVNLANRYHYSKGNPLMGRDPSGHAWLSYEDLSFFPHAREPQEAIGTFKRTGIPLYTPLELQQSQESIPRQPASQMMGGVTRNRVIPVMSGFSGIGGEPRGLRSIFGLCFDIMPTLFDFLTLSEKVRMRRVSRDIYLRINFYGVPGHGANLFHLHALAMYAPLVVKIDRMAYPIFSKRIILSVLPYGEDLGKLVLATGKVREKILLLSSPKDKNQLPTTFSLFSNFAISVEEAINHAWLPYNTTSDDLMDAYIYREKTIRKYFCWAAFFHGCVGLGGLFCGCEMNALI